MFELNLLHRPLISIIFIFAVTGLAISQTPEPARIPGGPPENLQKVITEKGDVFKRWVNEEGSFILTPDERRAFLLLKTNEEREKFIDFVWHARDPDPDTEANEFREEFYERIAYANEHFASGIPGWKTDRGRIYIMWGKPDSIETHPSGGTYDRPSYEGGGSATTYPFETWFYRHLDGPGEGVEIEFVDRTGTGEYSISRDPDEKVVIGTPTRSSDLTGLSNGFQREQDMPLSRNLRNASLFVPPTPKFPELYGALTGGPVIDNNPLNIDVRVDYFRQSDDRAITTFTVQADNKDLKFVDKDGRETATMNILGRITAVSNKRSGIFEDSVTTNATTAELSDARSRKSIYQKPLALEPGIYKVEVIVRDVGTGNRGVASVGFTVPKFDTGTLSTSSLVLASKLRSTNENDIGGRFVLGETKVVPSLSGVYKQGEVIGVYLQVYNAQIDQTTLRPAVDVDYVVIKDGKEVIRSPEDWAEISGSGQRLSLAKNLSSSALVPGDYQVKVEIRDRVRGNKIERAGKFTIIK